MRIHKFQLAGNGKFFVTYVSQCEMLKAFPVKIKYRTISLTITIQLLLLLLYY